MLPDGYSPCGLPVSCKKVIILKGIEPPAFLLTKQLIIAVIQCAGTRAKVMHRIRRAKYRNDLIAVHTNADWPKMTGQQH